MNLKFCEIFEFGIYKPQTFYSVKSFYFFRLRSDSSTLVFLMTPCTCRHYETESFISRKVLYRYKSCRRALKRVLLCGSVLLPEQWDIKIYAQISIIWNYKIFLMFYCNIFIFFPRNSHFVYNKAWSSYKCNFRAGVSIFYTEHFTSKHFS